MTNDYIALNLPTQIREQCDLAVRNPDPQARIELFNRTSEFVMFALGEQRWSMEPWWIGKYGKEYTVNAKNGTVADLNMEMYRNAIAVGDTSTASRWFRDMLADAALMSAAPTMIRALAVIVLTDTIRNYLAEFDPQALKQSFDAIADAFDTEKKRP